VHRAAGRSPSRAEAAFAVVLAVLAVLLTAVAIPIVWTRVAVLDTGGFAQVVDPLGDDPALRDAIAGVVADDAVEALSRTLASNDITESAARLVIQEGVRAVTGGSAFERFWATSSTDLHARIVDALQGDAPTQISLSYIPLVVIVLSDAGDTLRGLLGADESIPDIPPDAPPEHARHLLERGLGVDLPNGFGSIVLYHGGHADALGRTAGWIDMLAILLPLLAAALAAGATVLAHRRARTLAAIAVTVAVVAGFEVLTTRVARDVALTGVSSAGKAVAQPVVDAFRSSYVGFAQTVGLGALAVAAAAMIAGIAARSRDRRSA
jgi:hypothetical protein